MHAQIFMNSLEFAHVQIFDFSLRATQIKDVRTPPLHLSIKMHAHLFRTHSRSRHKIKLTPRALESGTHPP